MAFGQCNLQSHQLTTGIHQIIELDSGPWIGLAGNRQILRSTDQGQDWEILYDCSDLILDDLFHPTPEIIYVSAHIADIYLDRKHFLLKSIDGGNSWSAIHLPSESRRRDYYAFIGASVIYSFGESGFIWRSADGGISWQKQQASTSRDLYVAHFQNELSGIIAGQSGVIFRTEDGGENWLNVSLPSGAGDIRRLFFLNDQTGYLSDGSDIYQTIDGGMTWTLFHDGIVRYFQSAPNGNIFFRDAIGETVYTINLSSEAPTPLISDPDFESFYGEDVFIENYFALDGLNFIQLEFDNGPVRRKLLRSENDWQSWEEVPPPIDICRVPYSIFQTTDDGIHFHFQDLRNIYSSYDRGASWLTVSDMGVCGTNTSLNNLSAFETVSEEVLFAGNINGVFVRSATGGASWERLAISQIHDGPTQAIYFADTLNGLIVDDQYIYETVDGGMTWEYFEHGQDIWQLMIIDRFNWVIINKFDRLLVVTQDGGTSWNQAPLPDTGPTSSKYIASFIDTSTGYLITNMDSYDRIYKTTDSGQNWTLILDRRDTPELSRFITSIQFLDENEGAFGVPYGIIYKTSDGGVQWDSIKVRSQNPQSVSSIQFLTPEEGFVIEGTALNYISYTADGGSTWQDIGIAGSFGVLMEKLRAHTFLIATGDSDYYLFDQQSKTCLTSNIVGDTAVCNGSINYYSAGIPALDWTLSGGGDLFEDSSRMIRIRWQEAGDFLISAESLGCAEEPTTTLSVRVYPPVEQPEIYQFSDSVLRSTVSSDIQWYDVQGPIAGATGVEFQPPAPGNYRVIADNQLCLARSSTYFYFDFFNSITGNICDENDITLSGTTTGHTIEWASNTLSSTATIPDGKIVHYKAGSSIRLLPGFSAQSGSKFKAEIEACANMGIGIPPESKNPVTDFHLGLDLTLFPNPVDKTAKIGWSLQEESEVHFELYTISGNLIRKVARQTFHEGQHVLDIDVGDLASGMYILFMRAGKSFQAKKLVVN